MSHNIQVSPILWNHDAMRMLSTKRFWNSLSTRRACLNDSAFYRNKRVFSLPIPRSQFKVEELGLEQPSLIKVDLWYILVTCWLRVRTTYISYLCILHLLQYSVISHIPFHLGRSLQTIEAFKVDRHKHTDAYQYQRFNLIFTNIYLCC